jgi:hypothetical protein
MDTHHFQSPAMTDPTRLEPRNGDFVAYVEALQEESLEALRRANQAAIANPLQVPDASEGGADLGRIAAEMQRRTRAERGDEATHDAAQADMLRRTKESVAESFRRMGGATRGSTRAPAPQPHSPAPAPVAGRAPQARRRGVPLGFIGSACIMIGFFMTFAAMAEGREDLAGPFIFLMIVGGLIGRIAKSRR